MKEARKKISLNRREHQVKAAAILAQPIAIDNSISSVAMHSTSAAESSETIQLPVAASIELTAEAAEVNTFMI